MMTVGDAVKRAEEDANRKLCDTEDLDLSGEIRRSRKRKIVESDTGCELLEIRPDSFRDTVPVRNGRQDY